MTVEEATYRRRLPLYGPLHIESYEVYLNESKTTFDVMYNSVFPYVLRLDNFELHQLLGEGAFGRVILAQYTEFDGSYYAVKVQSRQNLVQKNVVEKALTEKKILQSLNNPFTIRLEYFSKDNSYIYYFLPFICGGALSTHLRIHKRFQENVAKFYAAQVILGLEYLHFLDLVFRDLKPENLLIDHLGFLKITDFGFTKRVPRRTYTFCGTPDYMAPEIIDGKGYGKPADWWALGVLIFEMGCGYTPFADKDRMQKFNKIVECQYFVPEEIGSEQKDLIANLLQTDVTRRFGNLKRGVADIKDHNWFKEINWLSLLNRNVTPPYVPNGAETVNNTYFPNLKSFYSWRVSTNAIFSNEFEEF